MLEGVTVTAAIPVPLRATFCGLLPALSLTLSMPVSEPRVAGVKVTEMVQLLPAESVAGLIGQLFV